MFPRERFFWVVCLGWAVTGIAFIARPTTPWILPLAVLLPCILIVVLNRAVQVFTQWSKRRWKSLVPLAISLGCFMAPFYLGSWAHEMVFAWCLPSYEAVVKKMESGEIPVSGEWARVPQAEVEARLVLWISAKRSSSGALTVEFQSEGGFPVRHGGYEYCSTGILDQGDGPEPLLPNWSKVRPYWFHFSDF